MKNKKVLVTGADGFIGSHLTEMLVSMGAEVTALAQYNSFNYWGNLEILALKDLAKQEMGSSYSDYAFHQFFLECGPSDFNSLAERLKEE